MNIPNFGSKLLPFYSVFPKTPGTVMPAVEGCGKQDYQVLIVIGMKVES